MAIIYGYGSRYFSLYWIGDVKCLVVVITHHLVMEEDGQAANQEMQQLIF